MSEKSTEQTDFYQKKAYEDFKEGSLTVKRLETQRSCTDIPCLVFMLMVIGGFLGYGSYISYFVYGLEGSIPATSSILSDSNLKACLIYVLMMLGISAFVALLLILTLRCWTYGACIIMAVVMFVVLFALAIINFIRGDLTAGIVIVVIIVIFTLFICCFKNELDKMVKIMRTVGVFTSSRTFFMLIPLTMAIISVIIGVFWITSYFACLQLAVSGLFTQMLVFTIFWIVCAIYLTLSLIYCSVFLIGGEVGLWFYKSSHQSISTPFRWLICYHLGTIGFAAALSIFVKILVVLLSTANHRRRVKGMATFVVACVLCMLSCVLHKLQYYTKILNNFAVIMCALTGKKYFDAAIFSAQFIMGNIMPISVYNLASWFLRLAGGITCAAVPTVISYFLFKGVGLSTDLITFGAIYVFATSLVVGLAILEGYIESMNSMFILYQFEVEMARFQRPSLQIADDKAKLELMYGDVFEEDFVRIGETQADQSPVRMQFQKPLVVQRADASSSAADSQSAVDPQIQEYRPVVCHIMETQKSQRQQRESEIIPQQISCVKKQQSLKSSSPTPINYQNFSSVSAGLVTSNSSGFGMNNNSHHLELVKAKSEQIRSANMPDEIVDQVAVNIPTLEAYKQGNSPVKICFAGGHTQSSSSIK